VKATPMRVTASTLRMHATPDAESPVTARLPQNAAVEVLDDPAWRFVRTPAGLGWVHGDYLAAAPPAPKRRTWRVAKSLGVLLAHIDASAPGRSRSFDGTIGDEAHQERASDHNPMPAPKGAADQTPVVSAEDYTHDPAHDADMARISEALRISRDPRIKYIIFNGRIVKSYVDGKGIPAWTWQKYTGANKHDHHMHVSVVTDAALYDSEKPWSI